MSHIIIFGAGSAIAQATAKKLASANTFTLIDRDQTRLDIVADDLKSHGAETIKTIPVDLTNISQHQQLVSSITNTHPDNILIAYGTLGNQTDGQKDFNQANKEITTNFTSVASLLTELTNHLPSDQKVTITVITSVAGDRGRASNYIYGSAKGALTTWLQGLRHRLTLEQSNIHLLTVKPGFVDTPMTANMPKGILWSKPEKIANDITKAIRKQKNTIYTPWFWRYIMLIIKLIPTPIFHKLKL